MEIGIVGLPNVGKSTIFNAVTRANAESSNYPFTTIDPNIAIAAVPDARLERLRAIFDSKKIIPASVKFVDIAGLVKGASQGEGLGNKFLANIRQVDAIMHMVRLFSDPDVVHTLGEVDPKRDIEIIETELQLADLDSVARQIEKTKTRTKSGDKAEKAFLEQLEKVKLVLEDGKNVRDAEGLDPEAVKKMSLLSSKPVLFVGNTDETPDAKALALFKEAVGSAPHLTLSGKIEAEIIALDEADRAAFLEDLGLKETGLERVILAAQKLLGLTSYFTAGPQEVRAWTIHVGWKAPRAAGVIHNDFERGFIRAEVYSFKDIDELGSELAVREKGKMRSEGKEYVMRDGDVCNFKFNV